MKKTASLIKNEFIKEFGKKSTAVILLLALAVGIMLPILSSRNHAADDDRSYLESQISWNDQSIAEIKQESGSKRLPEQRFYEIDNQVLQLQVDENISYSDYRTNLLDYYRSALLEMAGLQLYRERGEHYSLSDIASYLTVPDGIEEMDAAAIDQRLALLNTQAERYRQVVAQNSYGTYTQIMLEAATEQTNELQKQVDAQQKLVQADAQDLAAAEALSSLKTQLAQQTELVKLYQYRLDHDIGYGEDDYKNNALQELQEQLGERYAPMLDEGDFIEAQKGGQFGRNMTYAQYQESYQDRQKALTERSAVLWHSLEKNIPLFESSNKDPRSAAEGLLGSVAIAVIVVVVFAGSSVSREFSSGSIRLLLTRPVRRYKVYTAKWVTCMLLGLGSYLLMAIGTVVTAGIKLGFGGFGVPVLQYRDGAVEQMGFFSYLLPRMGYVCIAIIFIGTIAFFFSAVAKNTALAVALPTAGYFGSPLALQLAIMFGFNWVAYTPIAYMDPSHLVRNDGFLEQLREMSGVTLSTGYGAAMLLGIAALFFAAGMWVFCRRDITN